MEASKRTVHVIQPRTEEPEMEPGDRIFKYGAAVSGAVDRMIIHDLPINCDDHEWLRDYAKTRLAPYAEVIHQIRAPKSKYEGAGMTFWLNEKGQRVEMNKAFSDETHGQWVAKGWRSLARDNEPFHEWGEGTDADHVIKRKDEPAARHMVQHRRDYDVESYLWKRRPNQAWERAE